MEAELYRCTRPLIGRVENATYRESSNRLYRHNCYIEALPPRWDFKDLVGLITREPYYDEEERKKTALERLELVNNLAKCVFAMPDCIEIERKFSGMLRSGYCDRNPLSPEFVRQLRSGFPSLDLSQGTPVMRTTSCGFGIIGPSGVGKSLMVESILGLYPQVIVHEKYNESIFLQKQLVWLKIDCPFDATLGGLCISFFDMVDAVLGTSYVGEYGIKRHKTSIDTLLQNMAKLAAALGLGVLVIDEIQRLICRRENDPRGMLKFFEQLSNTFGVPVVLVGTLKAYKLFSESFASSRRLAGQGDVLLKNFARDECWKHFLQKVWNYQYTKIPTPLTPNLADVMYEESQGIADIAVKLYMLAQWRVIGENDERITGALIRKVADESLNAVRPILRALSNKDLDALKFVDDIKIEDRDLDDYFRTCAKKVTLSGVLNTLENQQKAITANNADATDSPVGLVASLLLSAGHAREIAINCARQAIDRFARETDIKKATAEAFRLAAESSEPEPVNHLQKEPQTRSIAATVSKTASKKVKTSPANGDLRRICAEAKRKGQPIYETLRGAGHIKPATEFMEVTNG
ncbi:MAG: ATP-binding protein [Deltaproteobacteria bacterium]|nr:ATP-binding protein [Deltaproteobacteria bacterium]TLN01976.1 MAG: ATP-binding protein [bacterium]